MHHCGASIVRGSTDRTCVHRALRGQPEILRLAPESPHAAVAVTKAVVRPEISAAEAPGNGSFGSQGNSKVVRRLEDRIAPLRLSRTVCTGSVGPILAIRRGARWVGSVFRTQKMRVPPQKRIWTKIDAGCALGTPHRLGRLATTGY